MNNIEELGWRKLIYESVKKAMLDALQEFERDDWPKEMQQIKKPKAHKHRGSKFRYEPIEE